MVGTVEGKLPSYPRWAVNPEKTDTPNAFLPHATPLLVTVAVDPKNKDKSVRSVIGELNILLTSISSTVQGFPIPAMKRCVNLLRTLHERWKANEQADLLDDGNILTFFTTFFTIPQRGFPFLPLLKEVFVVNVDLKSNAKQTILFRFCRGRF